MSIEKIDELIEKTGCSYEEAKKLLKETDGDVESAIINYFIESKKRDKNFESSALDKTITTIKALIKKGNVNRVVVKKEEKVIMDIPLNGVILATLFATTFSVVAVAILYLNGAELLFVKNDGSKVNIKDYSVEKGKKVYDSFKKKDEEVNDDSNERDSEHL